jgi:hypothetical protein
MVAILPAVVDHTGVAINLTPYKGIYWRLPAIILCTNPVFQMLSEAFTCDLVLFTSYGLLQAFDLGMSCFMPTTAVAVFPHLLF